MYQRPRYGSSEGHSSDRGYGGGGGGGSGGRGFGGGGYGGGGGFEQRSFAPVKVGEEIDVKIEAVGEKGDGIAKKNGFVLFVPGVKEGDEVKIRITKVLRKVGFAEVIGKGGSGGGGPAKSRSEAPQEGESSEEAAPQEDEQSSKDSETFGEEQGEQY